MQIQVVEVPEEYTDFVSHTNKNGIRTGQVSLIRWVRCQIGNVFEVETTSDKVVSVRKEDGRWVEVKS